MASPFKLVSSSVGFQIRTTMLVSTFESPNKLTSLNAMIFEIQTF